MNMERFIAAVAPAAPLHSALLVFPLMGWVFGICFFPPNLPSIALLIPAPVMEGTSHTGVYRQARLYVKEI